MVLPYLRTKSFYHGITKWNSIYMALFLFKPIMFASNFSYSK